MLKTSDTIATTKQRTNATEAVTGLRQIVKVTQDDIEFAEALEEACQQGGIDFAFAYAHCANETDYYRDSDFTQDHNPAGIGHPDGASGGIVFESFRAGARFYVGEMLLKLRRPIPVKLADARGYAPAKWDSVKKLVDSTVWPFPEVKTIDDLNQRFGPGNSECVWMCDEHGPEAIVAKGNRIFTYLPDQGGTTIPAGKHTTVIPGLPGGPLVTDYPIRTLLIPTWRTRNRPGTKARKPRRSVQHGNGNPNSTAAGEARYVYNGAGGRQASYHSSADDIEVWIMVPADEVTWQAADGAGPGNMSGFSCEMVEDADIWASESRRQRVIHNTADFMGRVAARLGIPVPEQHWDFNYVVCGCTQPCNTTCADRHNCPDKLRHLRMADGRLAWEHYVPIYRASRLDELGRMTGTPVEPPPAKPKYPTTRKPVSRPGTITFLGLPSVKVAQGEEDRWTCTHGTSARTYPDRNAPAAVKTPFKRGNDYTFPYETTVDDEVWLVSRAGTYALKKAFEVA